MTYITTQTVSFDPKFSRNVSYGLGQLGHIQEVVTIDGVPATGSYKVWLLRSDDGQIVASTMSAPGTGIYFFSGLPMEISYVPVTVNSNGVFKAVAAGPIVPTPDT